MGQVWSNRLILIVKRVCYSSIPEILSFKVKGKTPELEQLWAKIKTKLDKVVTDVNTQIPNANESAAQLQTKFNEAVQEFIEQSKTVASSLKDNSGKIQEEIAKYTKKAVDIAVDASQNLNTQLQTAAQPA